MKLLFVCTENRLRSPTAEALFSAKPDVEAIGCGIGPLAETALSRRLIEWADIVFVMEPYQEEEVRERYGEALTDTDCVCLDIPDRYPYMDAELVELLETRVAEYLEGRSGVFGAGEPPRGSS